MIGRVISTKMQKTAVILIERVAMHPLYRKTFKRSKKYLVDDPIGVRMGDLVEIIKISPVSKNKHWRITKVVGKNLAEIAEEKLKKEAEEIIAEVMPEEKEEVPQEEQVSQIPQGEGNIKSKKTHDTRGTRKSRDTSSKEAK